MGHIVNPRKPKARILHESQLAIQREVRDVSTVLKAVTHISSARHKEAQPAREPDRVVHDLPGATACNRWSHGVNEVRDRAGRAGSYI